MVQDVNELTQQVNVLQLHQAGAQCVIQQLAQGLQQWTQQLPRYCLLRASLLGTCSNMGIRTWGCFVDFVLLTPSHGHCHTLHTHQEPLLLLFQFIRLPWAKMSDAYTDSERGRKVVSI
jgi:hypothetical protein